MRLRIDALPDRVVATAGNNEGDNPMNILSHFNMDTNYVMVLLINLGIAMALLAGLKFLAGLISNVNATQELAEKDNPAFGISLAGVAMAITIMLTGVMSGEASASFASEAMLVAGYGLLGLILMVLTRFVFDRISMPQFSVKDAILKGNIAAGILDAGNVVATAIIIRALLMWVNTESLQGLAVILGGFVISQLILSAASIYRRKRSLSRHNKSLQDAIEGGNIAVAWRFTGFRIAVALAITAASGFIPYAQESLCEIMLLWTLVSICLLGVISILAVVTDKLILSGIDVQDEVDNQGNLAIGIIQCAITIAVGIIIAVLAH
jgi:uncharacterized membrane protein YjfL (UPF0719 family)